MKKPGIVQSKDRDTEKNTVAVVVVAQDPVLFTGTVRDNLDPFNRHADVQVWTALEEVSSFKIFVCEKSENVARNVLSRASNVNEQNMSCVGSAEGSRQ